jgi:hypothetical protein
MISGHGLVTHRSPRLESNITIRVAVRAHHFDGGPGERRPEPEQVEAVDMSCRCGAPRSQQLLRGPPACVWGNFSEHSVS